MARVTLQTIADKVGVSRMTVSNAFSRPDQLSATLRTTILAAADELGYAGPDPAARALARGSTGAVGIVLTDSAVTAFTDEVASRFFGAIASELAPTGLALTLVPAVELEGRVPARDVAMDAALVYHCDPDSPALSWLQKRGLPTVLVDQFPVDGIASVNVADRDGARAAAQHLVDLGHRHVGLVTFTVHEPHGITESTPLGTEGYGARERMIGWLDALNAAEVSTTAFRTRDSVVDGGDDALVALLRADPLITAVLCFSDVMAANVLFAAQDRGIVVPDQLSVVGFDDTPFASRVRPALTTVRQDVPEKGRLAAAAVIALLERGSTDEVLPAERTVLPTELIVRDSTAGPRSEPQQLIVFSRAAGVDGR